MKNFEVGKVEKINNNLKKMRVLDKNYAGYNKEKSSELSAVKRAEDKINHVFEKKLHFKILEKPNMIVVEVRDKETGKILNEIPSKEYQKIARYMDKLIDDGHV